MEYHFDSLLSVTVIHFLYEGIYEKGTLDDSNWEKKDPTNPRVPER